MNINFQYNEKPYQNAQNATHFFFLFFFVFKVGKCCPIPLVLVNNISPLSTYHNVSTTVASQCFQDWPCLNPSLNKPLFLCVCSTSLWKTLVGKVEIAHNEQFLLFTQCFLRLWRTMLFSSNLKLSSAKSFSLEASTIFCLLELNVVLL